MNKVFLKLPSLAIIKFIRKFENKKRSSEIENEFYELQKNKKDILNSCVNGYKVKPDTAILQGVNKEIISTDEYHLGEIDQDGFILPKINGVVEIPSIEDVKFLKRERNGVSLIIKDGYLAIKKEYGTDKYAFIKEVKALYKAGIAGCNVPKILDIDFKNLTLTLSYIKGKVLREELAKKGAIIRDSQVGKNSEFSYLKRLRIADMRIKEGKKYLLEVIDNNFIEETFNEYAKLHLNGIVNNDIKYGNIIIEEISKKPYIIDFESAFVFRSSKNFSCKMLAKHDMNILWKHFK